MADITGRNARDVEVAGPGTVAAVFKDHSIAEKAISDLTRAGFNKSDIGIAICQPEGSNVDEGWMSRVRNMFSSEDRDEYSSTDAPDTLKSMGIAEDRTQHFQRALHTGDVLVTVRAGARQQEAMNILSLHGGDLGLTTQSRARGTQDVTDLGQQRLQLFGETLRVHKERVQRGEVRLRKEVITEKKNIEVPVTREEIVIERVSGDRTQPVGSANFGAEKEIRVPVSEERVSVEKTPVVNEEVRIGKRQVQQVEHVSDDVRHEEVRVDKDGNVDVNDSSRDIKKDIGRRDDVPKKKLA